MLVIVNAVRFQQYNIQPIVIDMATGSHGVTVSTPDSESGDGGSNPPGTFFFARTLLLWFYKLRRDEDRRCVGKNIQNH